MSDGTGTDNDVFGLLANVAAILTALIWFEKIEARHRQDGFDVLKKCQHV